MRPQWPTRQEWRQNLQDKSTQWTLLCGSFVLCQTLRCASSHTSTPTTQTWTLGGYPFYCGYSPQTVSVVWHTTPEHQVDMSCARHHEGKTFCTSVHPAPIGQAMPCQQAVMMWGMCGERGLRPLRKTVFTPTRHGICPMPRRRASASTRSFESPKMTTCQAPWPCFLQTWRVQRGQWLAMMQRE